MSAGPQITIGIRLKTRAGSDRIAGWQSSLREQLVVQVQAPPVDGRANLALIGTLAESLGIAKSRVSLLRGHKSHHKLIAVGIDAEAYQAWASTIPVIGKG